jgi:hypothetical protein
MPTSPIRWADRVDARLMVILKVPPRGIRLDVRRRRLAAAAPVSQTPR